MSLTKKHCEEFLKNPSINPKTGRKIAIGKVTHKQLMEDCKSIMKRDKAPPMGPMMHWEMRTNGTVLNNLVTFANYVEKRIHELSRQKIVSKMELEDLENIMYIAKQEFSGKPKYVAFCTEQIEKLKKIQNEQNVIDDVPKPKIVGKTEVHVDRDDNRREVYAIWNQVRKNLMYMDETIQTKKIDITIAKGFIRDLMLGKKYLDYLIAHNIFTYDDIYKKTFTSEKVFEELAIKYQLYKKIYKEIKGESPI
jgi:hypothetical protein